MELYIFYRLVYIDQSRFVEYNGSVSEKYKNKIIEKVPQNLPTKAEI